MMHWPFKNIFCLACAFALSASVPSIAQDSRREGLDFFEKHIRPLLAKHCYECHSSESSSVKGNLKLDTRAGVLKGGDSGPAIVAGKPAESLLAQSVTYDDPNLQMPPKGRLTGAEIEALQQWITLGAPDPRSGTSDTVSRTTRLKEGRQHWSFQPVKVPQVPQVQHAEWVRSDIDRFIRARQEQSGITPNPDAARPALLRRVTLDLTGLAPTPQELAEFVSDAASDDQALAKVVDRLLASSAFGERWGRHWLDVVRYADSVGKTRNVPFPFAWRYRNYVIDSFNADKPYDRFMQEQVAGDLLQARDVRERSSNVVATGFLALGSMDLNERDVDQFRLDRIDDQMDTLGRSMLGLTLGCARCHDHKFDPISQQDYYALAGIFASTRTLSGNRSRSGGGNTYFHPDLLADISDTAAEAAMDGRDPAQLRAAELARADDLRSTLAPMVQRYKALPDGAPGKAALKQRMTALRRELQSLQVAQAAAAAGASGTGKGAKAAAKSKTQSKQQRLEAVPFDPDGDIAMGVSEGRIEDLKLRVRGEPDLEGDLVERGLPAVLRTVGMSRIDAGSSGREELGRWLASSRNPLTARVMVNRVWGHLFGRGLVETPDNFGVAGIQPTHPELLDYLAADFVKHDWSVKHLIRQLVLSRVYRLGTDIQPQQAALDEGNQLYWRGSLRRLDVEAIRDTLLQTSGGLEMARPAGAPYQAKFTGDLSRVAARGNTPADLTLSSPVRSVYLPVFRSLLFGMYTAFDFAEPDQVNGQRDVTTVPGQALFLLNNSLVADASERAARQLQSQYGDNRRAQLAAAWRLILCREAGADELRMAQHFVESAEAEKSGLALLIQALYASAEFRYTP